METDVELYCCHYCRTADSRISHPECIWHRSHRFHLQWKDSNRTHQSCFSRFDPINTSIPYPYTPRPGRSRENFKTFQCIIEHISALNIRCHRPDVCRRKKWYTTCCPPYTPYRRASDRKCFRSIKHSWVASTPPISIGW